MADDEVSLLRQMNIAPLLDEFLLSLFRDKPDNAVQYMARWAADRSVGQPGISPSMSRRRSSVGSKTLATLKPIQLDDGLNEALRGAVSVRVSTLPEYPMTLFGVKAALAALKGQGNDKLPAETVDFLTEELDKHTAMVDPRGWMNAVELVQSAVLFLYSATQYDSMGPQWFTSPPKRHLDPELNALVEQAYRRVAKPVVSEDMRQKMDNINFDDAAQVECAVSLLFSSLGGVVPVAVVGSEETIEDCIRYMEHEDLLVALHRLLNLEQLDSGIYVSLVCGSEIIVQRDGTVCTLIRQAIEGPHQLRTLLQKAQQEGSLNEPLLFFHAALEDAIKYSEHTPGKQVFKVMLRRFTAARLYATDRLITIPVAFTATASRSYADTIVDDAPPGTDAFMFELSGDVGIPLGRHAMFPRRDEWVFPSGTCWLINEPHDSDASDRYIIMSAVDSQKALTVGLKRKMFHTPSPRASMMLWDILEGRRVLDLRPREGGESAVGLRVKVGGVEMPLDDFLAINQLHGDLDAFAAMLRGDDDVIFEFVGNSESKLTVSSHSAKMLRGRWFDGVTEKSVSVIPSSAQDREVTAADLVFLSDALLLNPPVVVIDLTGCVAVDNNVAESLMHAACRNNNIRDIRLGSIPRVDSSFVEQLNLLVKCEREGESITVDCEALADDIGAVLGALLASMQASCFRILQLRKSVSDGFAVCLFAALPAMKNLIELVLLDRNAMWSPETWGTVTQALRESTIASLCLKNCVISDDGGAALRDVLADPTSPLEQLDITNSNPTPTALQAIIAGVRDSTTLQTLIMSGVDLLADFGQLFEESVSANKQLVNVILQDVAFSVQTEGALSLHILRNRLNADIISDEEYQLRVACIEEAMEHSSTDRLSPRQSISSSIEMK